MKKWYLTKDMLGVSSVKNRARPDIAWVVDTGGEDEMMANARLIAAAPLMYEALKDAINWYGLDGDGISDPTLSKLQAALAAAGGASLC